MVAASNHGRERNETAYPRQDTAERRAGGQARASRDMIFWFFLVLFTLSSLVLGWLLWPFISVIIVAAVVTGVFHPFYELLGRRLQPGLASFLTCVCIFCVLFVPIALFVGIVADEARNLVVLATDADLARRIGRFIENNRVFDKANQILVRFNVQLDVAQLNSTLGDMAQFVGQYIVELTAGILKNMVKFVINFCLMLLITFYLLIDKERLLSFLIDLSPLPDDQDTKLWVKFRDMAGAILVGNGLGGLIQGVLGGAVFALFGLPSAILWGVVMAFLAFLPIVGIGVVFIPAAVYLLIAGRVGAGVFFIIFYVVLSGGIEYLFKPKVVGTRVEMHTLLVFLAIIGGLNLFGILGIIYGPLVVTGFLTLTDIYHASYQNLVAPETKSG